MWSQVQRWHICQSEILILKSHMERTSVKQIHPDKTDYVSRLCKKSAIQVLYQKRGIGSVLTTMKTPKPTAFRHLINVVKQNS